ncbi:MAG: Abi family protein [Oscillospiraceae bacterium]
MDFNKEQYSFKDYTPRSISDLVKHLTKNRGITVEDENQLITYGYYHAYKGYRFFKRSNNIIPYTSFEQIIAVIDYDNALKANFYPELMFLETALKNIVVTIVMDGVPNASFDDVLKYKMKNDEGDITYNNRRRLKDKMRQAIVAREDDPIISHFVKRGDIVPIWAIFEVLSLSDFSLFIKCLDYHIRREILKKLGMLYGLDKDAILLTEIIYTLKDIRNSLAHNNVIFDTRFNDEEVNPMVYEWISMVTGINDIDFNSITDYFILITVLLKRIGYKNEKICSFVARIRGVYDELYKNTPQNIYTKITTTKLIYKLRGLENFLS